MRQAVFLVATFCAFIASADESDSQISRDVPLSSIVTTSTQKDLKHISKAIPFKNQVSASTNGHLQQMSQAPKSGASNIMLVDAKDIHEAVSASARVVIAGHAADAVVPINLPKQKHKGHWLVAFLGSGSSSPARWLVDSTTVQKNRIRLKYRKAPPSPATEDVHPYYFWIPLGSLEDGVYELELFDGEQNAVTLMRRVTVNKETLR